MGPGLLINNCPLSTVRSIGAIIIVLVIMGKKNILEVRVMDVEKRRYPTKHYVSL